MREGEIDISLLYYSDNNLELLFDYVLVLLFEARVYAGNEFGLKDYDMRRQQVLQDSRRLRWTEAGYWAEERLRPIPKR